LPSAPGTVWDVWSQSSKKDRTLAAAVDGAEAASVSKPDHFVGQAALREEFERARERDGSASERVLAIASAFTGTKFEVCLSKAILQEMWEKWVFIAAAAGISRPTPPGSAKR
jgi:ketopantoate reductase